MCAGPLDRRLVSLETVPSNRTAVFDLTDTTRNRTDFSQSHRSIQMYIITTIAPLSIGPTPTVTHWGERNEKHFQI